MYSNYEKYSTLKGRKPVPVKWVFKRKKEADGSIRLKSKNAVKGCIQFPSIN